MSGITNRDLYEEMRDMRKDVGIKIDDLSTKVNRLQINEATLSLKMYFVISLIVLVGSTAVTLVLNKVSDKIAAASQHIH